MTAYEWLRVGCNIVQAIAAVVTAAMAVLYVYTKEKLIEETDKHAEKIIKEFLETKAFLKQIDKEIEKRLNIPR